MKCTSWFGHRWSKWKPAHGKIEIGKDGVEFRQMLQIRDCSICGIRSVSWIDAVEEVTAKKNDDKDDKK